MNFIELKDENAANNDVIVGIDLGTTKSWIAFQNENHEIVIISNEHEKCKSTSSIVGICDKKIFIGENIPEHCSSFSSFKRLMTGDIEHCKFFEKKNDCIMDYEKNLITIDGQDFSPIHFSVMILKKLKNDAEKFFGHEVKKAVITIPAYFNENARNATKQAAEIAGLEVRRLINEPTAAALTYKIYKQKQGLYLVFDLGGGTFDISLLQIHEGVIQVLAVDGSLNLGGDDIDEIIFQKILHLFQTKYDYFVFSKQEKQYIYSKAKKIKEDFSEINQFSDIIAIGNKEINFQYSIDEFEANIIDFVEKTTQITKSILRKKEIKTDELYGIILVGGTTRIKLIHRKLQEIHPNILDDVNPDEIVVRGAAIQAYNLGNKTGDLLIDVLPISLGIETAIGVDGEKGLMEKVLFRNSPLPIKNKKIFTTSVDNQSEILINVYQGELENVENNLLLKQFVLKNIPHMPAYKPEVEVEFFVDVDGLLRINATEKITNTKQEFIYNMLFGTEKTEIDGLLQKQLNQINTDQKQKQEKEFAAELQKMIDVLQRIKDDVSSKQKNEIEHFLHLLQNQYSEKKEILKNINQKMESYMENFLKNKIKIK